MFIGWFFVAFGLLFAGFGVAAVVATFRHRQRQRTWTPSTAIIREIETRRTSSHNGGSRTQLIAHYEYRGPNGEEYADEGPLDSQRFSPDGSPLPLQIVTDPLDPSRSEVAGSGTPIGCAVAMGTLFVIFGFVFAMVGLAITQF